MTSPTRYWTKHVGIWIVRFPIRDLGIPSAALRSTSSLCYLCEGRTGYMVWYVARMNSFSTVYRVPLLCWLLMRECEVYRGIPLRSGIKGDNNNWRTAVALAIDHVRYLNTMDATHVVVTLSPFRHRPHHLIRRYNLHSWFE